MATKGLSFSICFYFFFFFFFFCIRAYLFVEST